jgi:hypothetical protein
LLDCEVMQVAAANFLQFYMIDEQIKAENEPANA